MLYKPLNSLNLLCRNQMGNSLSLFYIDNKKMIPLKCSPSSLIHKDIQDLHHKSQSMHPLSIPVFSFSLDHLHYFHKICIVSISDHPDIFLWNFCKFFFASFFADLKRSVASWRRPHLHMNKTLTLITASF